MNNSSNNSNYSRGASSNRGRSGGSRGGYSSSRSYSSGNGYRGRSSFSGSRSFGGGGRQNSRGGYNRGFRGGRGRGGGRFRGKGISLDPTRFIKKAIPLVEQVYEPKHKFVDFDIADKLKNNITAKGYETPTPIQDQSIPVALSGEDVIGIANTGTGKTAAFLIPLIDKVLKNASQKVLVLTPTRELANQAQDEFRGFSAGTGIRAVRCIGGENIRQQISFLKRRHNFVIGTPGRVMDLYKQGFLKLEEFENIVLDEVDRMVDMGFIKDMEFILGKLPKERQSLFFSATLSKQVNELILKFLKSPVTVAISTQKSSDNVEQDIVKIGADQKKLEVLASMLRREEFKKTLIFVRTKIMADRLDKDLYRMGFKVDAIHGDKRQNRRKIAITKFKEGRVNILVATDVVARGIDIPDISHVINYDIPETYEDYIHRIGRTGRAQKQGFAFTFVD